MPAAFVGLMLVGGLLSFAGVNLPSIEIGITLSVLALGTAIALDKKLNIAWAMAFVGFFAIFHGYAHGNEMPSLARPALYAIGFILATALMHIIGVGIGLASEKVKDGPEFLRFVGAGIAGIGFAMLFGM